MAAQRDRFGTHPDIPDARDLHYEPPVRLRRRLPARADLRPHCPPVFDQLKLNSCSANAIASSLWMDLLRGGKPRSPAPSRLFIYYNERAYAGLAGRNAPVSLRDGYRAVVKHGVCDERLWPYDPRQFARTPTSTCYGSARGHRAQQYRRLPRELRAMRACLIEGFPFAFGLSVHRSMLSAAVLRSGEIPLPGRGDPVQGGHALLAVGYDDARRCFIVRNAWGTKWGLEGYGLLPYDYVIETPLTWDFWTCRRVGGSVRWGRRAAK